jgi:hypothetical protein
MTSLILPEYSGGYTGSFGSSQRMNGRMKHPQPLGLSLSVVGWSVGWLGIWLRGAAVRPVNQPGSDAGCHRRKRWRRADDLGAPLTPCTRHTERSSAASRST